jgi:ribosomal protein S18 acetylase RimI-like enzyme
MVTYRIIRKQDVQKIQKLALESWLFTYRKIYTKKTILKEVADFYSTKRFELFLARIKRKKEYFIVAIDKNNVVGYAHVGTKNKKWELFRIYINPSHIRKGIGGKLIYYIEKFLKSKRAKKYIVYPHIKNKIAKNFYSKVGFQRNKSKDRSKSSICYEKNI